MASFTKVTNLHFLQGFLYYQLYSICVQKIPMARIANIKGGLYKYV